MGEENNAELWREKIRKDRIFTLIFFCDSVSTGSLDEDIEDLDLCSSDAKDVIEGCRSSDPEEREIAAKVFEAIPKATCKKFNSIILIKFSEYHEDRIMYLVDAFISRIYFKEFEESLNERLSDKGRDINDGVFYLLLDLLHKSEHVKMKKWFASIGGPFGEKGANLSLV